MESLLLICGLAGVAFLLKGLSALSADRVVNRFASQEMREYPVGAAETIYRGGYVGVDPAGYVKPFEPGDLFVGIAYEGADNSAGAAGAVDCRVIVAGDFELTLTSAALTDVGAAVYATADDTIALSGHPDGYVGRVLHYVTTNTVVVRLKAAGEKPTAADTGCYELVTDYIGTFPPTTADGAGGGPQYVDGFKHTSILGLGVHQIAGEDSGAQLDFDAVAEVAAATIETSDVFPVDKGVTFEARLVVSDIGDDGALDVDWGLGTLLTANSIADIDHTDMAQLACFHLNGASANILAQSDDATTDVAAVDTTIDNDATTDVPKTFKIIVRPAGTVEFWIDGARVLSTTSFGVLSTAALAGWINVEKTSNDTVAVVLVDRIRVAGGRA